MYIFFLFSYMYHHTHQRLMQEVEELLLKNVLQLNISLLLHYWHPPCKFKMNIAAIFFPKTGALSTLTLSGATRPFSRLISGSSGCIVNVLTCFFCNYRISVQAILCFLSPAFLFVMYQFGVLLINFFSIYFIINC